MFFRAGIVLVAFAIIVGAAGYGILRGLTADNGAGACVVWMREIQEQYHVSQQAQASHCEIGFKLSN